MGITTLFDYFKTPVSKVPLFTALLYIKSGIFKEAVDELRQYYFLDLDTGYDMQKRLMLQFSVAGSFSLENKRLKLNSYSRCIALELPYVNEKDLKPVKKLLSKNPFVTACFTNALGIGLVIIVRTESGLAQHQEVFKSLADYFEDLTGVRRIAKSGDVVDHAILMSADQELLFNEDAVAFQSIAITGEEESGFIHF